MSKKKFDFKPNLAFLKPFRTGHRFEILFTIGVLFYLNNKINNNFLHSFQSLEKSNWEELK